jgi:hypothetical protein
VPGDGTVDWLLSHHLLGTEYRAAPFALLEHDEPALLDAPEALLGGDLEAIRASRVRWCWSESA